MAALANKYNQWKFIEQWTTWRVYYSKLLKEWKGNFKRQGYQTLLYKNEIMKKKLLGGEWKESNACRTSGDGSSLYIVWHGSSDAHQQGSAQGPNNACEYRISLGSHLREVQEFLLKCIFCPLEDKRKSRERREMLVCVCCLRPVISA